MQWLDAGTYEIWDNSGNYGWVYSYGKDHHETWVLDDAHFPRAHTAGPTTWTILHASRQPDVIPTTPCEFHDWLVGAYSLNAADLVVLEHKVTSHDCAE